MTHTVLRYVSTMNQMIPALSSRTSIERLSALAVLSRSPLTAPSVGTVATWHGRYVICDTSNH